jgi:hypothetical protein
MQVRARLGVGSIGGGGKHREHVVRAGHLRVDLGVGSIGGGGMLDLGSASDWTWAWEASEAVLGPILRVVRPDKCL